MRTPLTLTSDECVEAIRAKAEASCNPAYKRELWGFLELLEWSEVRQALNR